MLHLRRRHLKACTHKDSAYLKCKCPLWVVGALDGTFIRKSLDTRNLEKAESMRRQIEMGALTLERMSVSEAGERWIADCEARQLKPPSIRKYQEVKRELVERFGNGSLRSVAVDDLRKLRESWKFSGTTTQKRLELVRAFFSFCVASGWLETNPAKGVKAPKVRQAVTLPFTDAEIEKLLWAVDTIREIHPQIPVSTQKQLRAMVLLILHSGIRISDAVTMKPDRVKDGNLFLYTQKTGAPVWCPLPPIVLKALKDCDEGNPYYFWSGVGTMKSRITEWQNRLQKVMVIASVEGGHFHRLRDSFSVRLLEKGVPLETVAVLLGNTLQVCQKHYSPWVKSRQTALEDAVKLSWTS